MSKKILIPILVLAIVAMSCSVNLPGKNTKTEEPEVEESVEIETDEVETEEVETEMPKIEPTVMIAPTEQLLPTLAPTLAPPSGYFTDDFSGDVSSWVEFVIAGDASKSYMSPASGVLRFEIPGNTETYDYAEYVGDTQDVYVEATFETMKTGKNGVSVMCRTSGLGWYEFRVSTSGSDSSGSFFVYRFDFDLRAQKKNPYVNMLKGYDRLKSVDLVNGLGRNTIGILCSGNQISYYINGIQQKGPDRKVMTLTDDTLTSGGVGIGAMSFNSGDVIIEFDSVEVSPP